MKALFLTPPQESLGVECLSAALKAAGFETALVVDPLLFDEPGFVRSPALARLFRRDERVLARVVAERPDLLCLSVTTDYYAWAKSWAARVKRALGVPVIFGGIHPTSAPERVLGEDCVDYVCEGEGDEALVDLARALRDGTDDSRIPNIWLKRGGRVVANRPRPPVADLDRLPFPDKELYRSSYPIFDEGYLAAVGRGCPLSCAYCCNSVYDALYGSARFLRRRSPGHVMAELESASRRWRPRFVHFADDVFNHSPGWLREFLPLYRRRVGLPFSCYVYPDLADEEQARLLRDAGCFKVQLGLQTGDEAKRAAVYGRPSKNERIARAIRAFKDVGVYVVADNILGLPGETEADTAALLDFYDGAMPDANEVFFLRCYPGSALTRWAVDGGRLSPAAADAIADGRSREGLFGGSDLECDARELRRTAALLTFYPLLPPALRRAAVRHGVFRRLPALPRLTSMISARLLRRPLYDFNTLRARRRFAHFVGAALRGGGRALGGARTA